jgi:chromosome segregation ATPase
MYEIEIQKFHNQLMFDYDKLESTQAELLSARKALHEIRVAHRGDTTQVPLSQQQGFIDSLRKELQIVNHDLGRSREELEEVKREMATLENTRRKCEEDEDTASEEFVPRKTNKKTNLRAKFVEESELVKVMSPSKEDDRDDVGEAGSRSVAPTPREELRGHAAYPMKGREPGPALNQDEVGKLILKDFLPISFPRNLYG